MKKKYKVIIILSIIIIILIFICFVPLIWQRQSSSGMPTTYDENEIGKESWVEGWNDYVNDCYDCRVVYEGNHEVGTLKFDISYFEGEKKNFVTSINIDEKGSFKRIVMIPHISEKEGMIYTWETYTADNRNSYVCKIEQRYTILQYIIKEIKYKIDYIKECIKDGKEG